jgi:hypothetical protein
VIRALRRFVRQSLDAAVFVGYLLVSPHVTPFPRRCHILSVHAVPALYPSTCDQTLAAE